jgi:hypothetical protein
MIHQTPPQPPDESSFERQAAESQSGLIAEFIAFLRANKKWWLLPLLLALGAIGLIAVLGGSAAAPFIYTLF